MSQETRSWTRRGWLGGAILAGCAKKRAAGFDGWAFVALQGSDPSVAVVDLMRFEVRRRIAMESAPVSVFPHPDPASGCVLTLLPQARKIEELDVRTLERRRSFRLPAPPIAAKPGFDGKTIWSLSADGPAIHGLELESGKSAGAIALPARPVSWALHPKQPAAAVALEAGELLFADLASRSVRKVDGANAGASPGPLAFRSDGRYLLAANRSARQLNFYEFPGGAATVELPLSLRPDRFCMNSDGGQLFITGEGQDAVVIAYPYRTEIAQTTLSGRRPGEMATSDAPPFLFVSNPDAGSVTAFDIATQKVLAVIGVGIQPGPIAVTQDQRYVLVLHAGSGDLGVIRIATITAKRAKSAPLFTLIPIGERPAGLTVLPAPPV